MTPAPNEMEEMKLARWMRSRRPPAGFPKSSRRSTRSHSKPTSLALNPQRVRSRALYRRSQRRPEIVADEVRNLAQRSAQSAKETAAKIEDSVQKSANGVQICGKVAQSLSEIVAKAREVDSLVAEIATASSEQTEGISQVNIAITQMDKVTQSNAAGAEESAAAAEELTAQTVVPKGIRRRVARAGRGQFRQAIRTNRSPVTAESHQSSLRPPGWDHTGAHRTLKVTTSHTPAALLTANYLTFLKPAFHSELAADSKPRGLPPLRPGLIFPILL